MIPAGWTETTLKNVLSRGSSNLSANKLIDCDGNYPVYGASGLVKKVNFYQQEKDYLAVIKDGAGVGRVYHYEANSSVLGTLQYLFPKPDINIRFAYYFLTSIDYKKYYQGAAIPHIYYKDYCNEKIVLPPLPEQKRIVDKLDTLFADIDAEKQIVQQNLQNSKELFESELHKLFTENTDDWEEKQLGEICNIAIGKTPSRGSKAFWDTELQTNNTWLSIADLNSAKNKVVDTSTERISNKALPLMTLVSKGTLLLSFKLTIGRLAFAGKDLYTNEAIAQLPIKGGVQIDKYYLYYYLSAFDYETLLKGDVKVKGKSLNKQKLHVLPVSYPSLTEQRRVVEKLDALHEQTQELEQIYIKQIADLDELKQSILKKAFYGEL